MEQALKTQPLTEELLLEAKRMEFPDYMIANLCGRTEADIKALRQGYKITAAYKMVDTCAAEFAAATPYYYSVYGGPDTENEAVAAHDKKKVLVLGSGPIRIGQGIEFDYCCVHAALALKKLGFADVVEVAIGADITTRKEAAEFIEKTENGEKMMTTSCCPAYYKAADLHIPEIKPFVSHTRTPMYYTAELLKQEQPECTAVFVGPCLAKRFEAENDPNVDYVLTFEEIGAMLVASGINVADCEPQEFAKISCAQGRRFPVSGGVAGAVASLVEGKAEFKPTAINGLNKASIKLLKQYATKGSDFNMIEVMCCEGGCVAGPGCVALAKKSAIMVENYVKTAPDLKDKQD